MLPHPPLSSVVLAHDYLKSVACMGRHIVDDAAELVSIAFEVLAFRVVFACVPERSTKPDLQRYGSALSSSIAISCRSPGTHARSQSLWH